MLEEEIKELVKSTDNKVTSLINQVSGFETRMQFQANTLGDQNDRLKDVEAKLHKVELDLVRFLGIEKEIKRLNRFVEKTVETSEAMMEKFSKAYQGLLNKQQKNTFIADMGSKVFYMGIAAFITWLATGNPR